MGDRETQQRSTLKFGDILVECDKFAVYRMGERCELSPRAFDVLIYLVDNRGRVVEKQELFDAVWKDTFVTDNALMRAVREIRRALGDSATTPKYVETVHKRGYRFIASVEAPMGENLNLDELTTPPGSIAPGWSRYLRLSMVLLAGFLLVAVLLFIGKGERRIRSIVVLPLENASAGESSEHIFDGISESVINSLSELPEIKVVARATAFRYRGREFDPQEIRRELGVDAILTGRVVQTGPDVTVQADLIDASDGSQIWGSRYNRKLAAVYELPGAIAADLVRKLELNLTAEQMARLTKNYTQNPEAYDLYQLGRYFWNKRSLEALTKSIDYFQQAIEKDPNYALAYAGLADSYAVMAISADVPAHEVFPKARLAAEKALELDDSLVEPHATMLRVRSQYEWDWVGAETEYQKALELNPNYPMTHIYHLSYLVSVGKAQEAVTSVKKAYDLDPLSLVTNAVMARALFFAGRYDEAIAAAQKTLEMDQNVFLARLILGRSYARTGMFDRAIAELEKARNSPGSVSEATSLLAHTLAVSGKGGDARRLLSEMRQLASTRYVQPYDIALVHAGLGDKDAAFDWLEKAYQHKNHQVPLINAVPEFEVLRADPRFADLVERFGVRR